jgi:cbb3-type cytochrome oxidase subunit 3
MESAFTESSMEPIGTFDAPPGSGSGFWWILGWILVAIILLAVVCHCLLPQRKETEEAAAADLNHDLQHPTVSVPEHEMQPHAVPAKGQQWCFIGDDGDQRVCGQGASCQSGAAFLTQEACLRAD